MASEPERGPGLPGASGVPVKPVDAGNTAVPASWLLESEHLTLAENVDRLAADNELINTLAYGSFTGPDWEYFSTELAKYGMAVIAGWMRRGMISGSPLVSVGGSEV